MACDRVNMQTCRRVDSFGEALGEESASLLSQNHPTTTSQYERHNNLEQGSNHSDFFAANDFSSSANASTVPMMALLSASIASLFSVAFSPASSSENAALKAEAALSPLLESAVAVHHENMKHVRKF